jgi:uncharacterized protein with GYD domain
MPKYLFTANLTMDGIKGTMKEGGTARKAAVEKAIKSLGGTPEAYYYAFGGTDVVGIADMPDNVSAAAFALLVTVAGGAAVSTTVLLTPEEVDEIAKKTGDYRPPGK